MNNRFVVAKEEFSAGQIDKFEYGRRLNAEHLALFDYRTLLAGSDVASIEITAEGISVRSASHGIALFLDEVDLHATPYTLLDFGQYEVDETTFLKSVLNDGDVFLDVGANLGWYSLVLGKQCPNATIHAFEPIPQTIEKLKRNVSLNALSNIEAHALGVFNKEQEVEFLFAADVSGATSMKVVGQTRGDAELQPVKCRTTTLDLFCRARGLVPQVLKVDVEGAELMVMQGAEQTLASTPIILVELLRKWSKAFDYHPNDVLALLAHYGYQAWVFNDNGRLQRCLEVTDETLQTNYIFMHPQRHARVVAQWAEA